jgi:hypothetical protein
MPIVVIYSWLFYLTPYRRTLKMSDSNRTGISLVEEVTWGTNPATQQRDMAFTGESLSFNIDNITSNSIRSDRQVTDLIQTGASCAGDINFELKYATEISDLLQGSLWDSRWHGVGSSVGGTFLTTAANTCVITVLTNTFVFNAAFVTAGFGLAVGQTFTLTGTAGALNDGTFTVETRILAGTLTVTTVEIPGGANETLDDAPVGTFVVNILETLTADATASGLDFSFNLGADTLTLGANIPHDIVQDQWIEVNGATANNNGYHRVVTVVGQVITVEATPGFGTTEVVQAAATVKGARIRNGVTENSYWIERSHGDITQFFQFAGMVINTMNMTFAANAIATGTFGFIGRVATLTQATSGTGTNAAAATTNVMNAVANVGTIRINNVAAASCLVQEIGISLNNNVRGLSSIGYLGFCDVGVGEVALTGTLNLYFLSDTYYDLYLAGTAFSLEWKVEDAAGNAYIFRLPECKFNSDTVNASSKNTDILENAAFTAIMDPTYGYCIEVIRISA